MQDKTIWLSKMTDDSGTHGKEELDDLTMIAMKWRIKLWEC